MRPQPNWNGSRSEQARRRQRLRHRKDRRPVRRSAVGTGKPRKVNGGFGRLDGRVLAAVCLGLE